MMAKEPTPVIAKPAEMDKAILAAGGPSDDPQKAAVVGSQDKAAGKKTYEQMIIDAITENDLNRKGISFVSIQKIIRGKYMIESDIKVYVKKAYEKLSEKKIVERVSGTGGINGSIRFTKTYTDKMKKAAQPATDKPKPAKKATEKPKKPAAKPQPKKKKDKNNNSSDKGKGEAAGKPKPKPAAKLNPKKTAITKTKIDRSSGKVRLSIMAAADPTTAAKTSRAIKTKRTAAKPKVDKTESQMPAKAAPQKPKAEKVIKLKA
uniref:H15 domain-containing protein n=1 Tax=Anopheles dirus TaxID=7168 RepID=A0A182NGP3_9DIPT